MAKLIHLSSTSLIMMWLVSFFFHHGAKFEEFFSPLLLSFSSLDSGPVRVNKVGWRFPVLGPQLSSSADPLAALLSLWTIIIVRYDQIEGGRKSPSIILTLMELSRQLESGLPAETGHHWWLWNKIGANYGPPGRVRAVERFEILQFSLHWGKMINCWRWEMPLLLTRGE